MTRCPYPEPKYDEGCPYCERKDFHWHEDLRKHLLDDHYDKIMEGLDSHPPSHIKKLEQAGVNPNIWMAGYIVSMARALPREKRS